jgi:hypothetical protein
MSAADDAVGVADRLYAYNALGYYIPSSGASGVSLSCSWAVSAGAANCIPVGECAVVL